MSNTLNKRLDNNKKDIRQFNKNKQKPVTLSNFTRYNRLLTKLFSTFGNIVFNKSEFLVSILVSNT